jgi:hypothetical protein
VAVGHPGHADPIMAGEIMGPALRRY